MSASEKINDKTDTALIEKAIKAHLLLGVAAGTIFAAQPAFAQDQGDRATDASATLRSNAVNEAASTMTRSKAGGACNVGSACT